MTPSIDVTTTDRTAAAQRAVPTAPIPAGLTSARAALFARTFAVWRMRAENGQGTSDTSALPTPADSSTSDTSASDASAADAARAQDAREAAQRDAAKADDTHRAWRQMVEQATTTPAQPDPTTALVAGALPVDAARTETVAAGTTGDPSTPVTDPSTLDPAMKDRLDRVISRMQQAGHTVTVTEAARSQSRQDALYAQGRTAPGPVVTWTRQSRHLDGLAADVQVDGNYNNPDAYALLGKIANEEGLSTLGAKDPGHLELHAGDALASLGQMANIKDAQITVDPGVSRSARTAQVAQVAQVARVAQVAQVAPVATVAAPAAVTPPASDSPTVFARTHSMPINTADVAPDAGDAATVASRMNAATALNAQRAGIIAPGSAQALAVAAALGGSATGAGSENGFGQDGQPGARARALFMTGATSAPSVRGAVNAMTANALAGAMGTTGTAPSAGGIGTSATRGATTAMRADEIQSLIESRDKQPVSRMLLTVDDEAGGVDRIRVDVRGARVGAQMTFGANGDATQAASQVSELARALEQRGLAPDALKVANAAAGASIDPTRSAAPASDRGSSTAPRQDDAGRSPNDQPRQRSRREQGDPR